MCYSHQESWLGRGRFGIKSDLVLCTLKQPLHGEEGGGREGWGGRWGERKEKKLCEKGKKILKSKAEHFAAVQGK